MFSFFKKKSPDEHLRETIRKEFNKVAREALKQCTSDPLFGPLMFQASICDRYQEMKGDRWLETMYEGLGVDYQSILSEECNNVLDKYLIR
jgi:hypothetical protein